MGCASSTPMVATAGSEMLKAATHVAGDVKQKGEEAVEDATQALSSTLDTAKETVSTAVAGVTSELGNALKDGTAALDEAKHKVMEGLHLETKADADAEQPAPSTSRAPTPALEADADSLKTSTPEPEIERALANSAANEEETPPTPKPSLQELAELSTQVGEAGAAADATVATATTTATAAATVEQEEEEEEQRRPSTTEWEKLADQLAKSRKFRPYESFAHTQNHFSVYKDYTSMRDKPNHYDGHFSDGNSLSSTSQSQSSSGHLTPAPPTRRGQREYAKFVGSEQPASVSRASSRLSHVGSVRTFDFNPQRERITLPISRVGSRAGSARRSLWAREQPTVLPEEPPTHSPVPVPVPVRRSSMVPNLGQRAASDIRNLPAARSTSNLTSSSLQQLRQRQKTGLPTADAASEPSKLTQPEIEPTKGEHVSIAQVVELATESSKNNKKLKEEKPQLSETFKSMLGSSRDISSALLLATPLTVTSMPKTSAEKEAATCNKMPTPLAARAATFVAEPTETRQPSKSTVTHATPHKMRQVTAAGSRATSSPLGATSTTTPQRSYPNFATTVPKLHSPGASRASSRQSSSSSAEVIIRPLSHLNTPSAVSLSPDQVVMTEYDDSDLEAALARLADWRGSNTTLNSLHSMRSTSSRLVPNANANATVVRDSRRTSPWLRRNMEHNIGQELKPYASCGIVELSSPAKTAHQLLERCEICCNEFVMK